MLDDILEAALEFILEITVAEKLDKKWEEMKEKWRKRRERRTARKNKE